MNGGESALTSAKTDPKTRVPSRANGPTSQERLEATPGNSSGLPQRRGVAPKRPDNTRRHVLASAALPQWVYVVLGGGLGTLARAGLDALAAADPLPPPVAQIALFSWSTILADMLGAFLLGAFNARLIRRAAPTPALVRLRLFAATGFLGAFTTYGTVHGVTVQQLFSDLTPSSLFLALISSFVLIAVGAIAAGAGWALGRGRKMEQR